MKQISNIFIHSKCSERRELILMNINLSILGGTVLTANTNSDFSCRQFVWSLLTL